MIQAHVLVVDDDQDLRETLAGLLEEEGLQVSVAENGLVALERLARESLPDVILLDLMMPESDGYDFRARQLADARISHIAVIGMTASGNEAERISELRADGFLRKPFDFTQLLALIQRLVGTAHRTVLPTA